MCTHTHPHTHTRRLGLDFREVERSHHRGEADEEQSFEGDAEAGERRLGLDFREVEGSHPSRRGSARRRLRK